MSLRYIVIICFTIFGNHLLAQNQSIKALEKDFPKLTNVFGKELDDQKADYIFAVDVSGTMNSYKDIVVPALQEFFYSLQSGDYVSLIRFGGVAKNDVGSCGIIDKDMVKALVDYAPNLYNIPTDPNEKRQYYNYTDLDRMLHYLADDMKQIERNKLKFIFIITDFVHDPSGERKGKEDWDGVTRRFNNEQIDNDVYVFALQLPGSASGRDYPKVRSVFPNRFQFELQEIKSRNALAEWFKRKKNEILLDKFTALIRKKVKDLDFNSTAKLSIDGDLVLDINWQPNQLISSISIDTLTYNNDNFGFSSCLPVILEDNKQKIEAGRIFHKEVSLPFFQKMDDTITVKASTNVEWQNELTRLGIEQQGLTTKMPVSKNIFTFFFNMPLWLFLTILALIILYIILVIRASRRNRAAKNMINGSFVVRYQSDEICRKQDLKGMKKVDIGNGATILPVGHNNCDWKLEIYYKTYSPLRCFTKPECRVSLTRGARFKLGGREYMNHQHPKIWVSSTLAIRDFTIKWLPPKR